MGRKKYDWTKCLRDIEFQLPELAEAGINQITVTEQKITVTEQTLLNSTSFIQTPSLTKTQSL